jgi:maltooligosyltrehalose trehalohydrolase
MTSLNSNTVSPALKPSNPALEQDIASSGSGGELKHPLRFGAQLVDTGLTRFRLWAPDATVVLLLFTLPGQSKPEEIKMEPLAGSDKEGWFGAEISCGAGTRYRYRILNKKGNSLTVPDPASRTQADGVHGDSVVVDMDSYSWQQSDWKGRPWHETVIYQVHPGIMGGFNGIREKLAGLSAIGFTAIQLMPIASFPGRHNWGYDGVLPFAPQSSYGTPGELKAMIDHAHSLGMMVFNDVVYNHFGPDGNYLGHYAGAFFRHDIKTLWGSAIDFTQPEVRNFYTENVMYWLQEYKFDGLRFDACHAIADKSWLFEIAARVKQQFGGQRYVHLMAENDDNTASLLDGGIRAMEDDSGTAGDFEKPGKFTAQWNDDGHHVLHVLLTGEDEGYYSNYSDRPAEKLARCLAEGFIYQGEHSPDTPVRGEPSANLPPTAFVFYLQNHDQVGNRPYGERLTTLVDHKLLRAASALVLLCPHIPMLFMGEEFGATQPFLYFTSHDNQDLVQAIREGRRKEFSKFAKFSDASIATAIPDSNLESTFLTSMPNGDNTPISVEWEQWTRKLLSLRWQHIIPRLAGAHALEALPIGPAGAVARWRMADGATLVIAINLSTEPVTVKSGDISIPGGTDVLFDTGNVLAELAKGSLPACSFIALLEPSS